ncbi:hypothetical protein OG21DRAFT_1480026 [Imleria badia]|nr:hypothetical protein OG21DRAFT_1480026 [Imleria badia]
MSDLALVRAEIKCWERDFANKHARDPSVQDIREQPAIAEKYKLYKKLSKAAAAPRRPPESVPPLPGFNPFSPVKKSAKHTRPFPASPHPNPFATPAKNKPNHRPRTATPSPGPGPSILPHTNASPSHAHPVSTTAVSRARKRLRGEPVSPSPNKPKRQRIRSQAPPPFPKLDSSDSEHEDDQELPQCDFTASFVADSPVKAPAGGKSFKHLFDDALPALSIAKKPVGAHLDSAADPRFPQRASADHSVPVLRPHRDLKSKGLAPGPEHRVNRIQGKLSAQIFPTKDHFPAPSHKPTFKPPVSQPRTSVKRALDGNDSIPLVSHSPLIPPSPPPQDSINRDTGKGKAKTTAGRKKLRVENEESDQGADSPDDITLKVATVSFGRTKHRHADDIEWDPLLHLTTRNHEPAAEDQIDANHHASGTFSVDLPDKFRRVLAISPSRSQNSTEERVVRGLLYGDRVGHYDPSRGGNIWDAGETDEGVLGDAETEDDWEGAPVPWEVGEL